MKQRAWFAIPSLFLSVSGHFFCSGSKVLASGKWPNWQHVRWRGNIILFWILFVYVRVRDRQFAIATALAPSTWGGSLVAARTAMLFFLLSRYASACLIPSSTSTGRAAAFPSIAAFRVKSSVNPPVHGVHPELTDRRVLVNRRARHWDPLSHFDSAEISCKIRDFGVGLVAMIWSLRSPRWNHRKIPCWTRLSLEDLFRNRIADSRRSWHWPMWSFTIYSSVLSHRFVALAFNRSPSSLLIRYVASALIVQRSLFLFVASVSESSRL